MKAQRDDVLRNTRIESQKAKETIKDSRLADSYLELATKHELNSDRANPATSQRTGLHIELVLEL